MTTTAAHPHTDLQAEPVDPAALAGRLNWLRAGVLGANGGIVSVAAIMAVGVNADGRREVLGMEIGTSEARRSRPSSCAS